MNAARLLAAVVVAVVVAGGAAWAGEAIEVEAVDVSARPEISLTISLPADVVAAEPDADDFAVVVDGTRVTAEVYAALRDPMEVVVVMDASGSMAGEPIERAAAAALAFVGRLPSSARVAVVSFGDDPAPLTAMGATHDEVVAALTGLRAAGETSLYDAVVFASGLFEAADARHILVVLSDGADTVSAATLEDALAAVGAAGADLRAVALQSPEASPEALQTLSGGEVTTAVDANALAAAYTTVALDLTGRYRLTFSTAASGLIEIEVFVRSPSGVLAASQQVDLATGAATARATPSAPPAGFGMVDPGPAEVLVAAPGRFDQPWTLPAGIAFVFLGTVAALWLTSRSGEDGSEFRPLEGILVAAPKRPGLLAAVGSRVRLIGDGVARRSRAGAIDAALDRAGLAVRPGEFVVVAATAVVVGVTLGLVLAGLVGAVILGGAAALAPRFVLRTLAVRRRRAFADQLEGTLQTLAGSLRAGYGLVQAISTVATEAPEPTATEFNRVVVENRLGRSIEDSMTAMTRRLDDEDLGWVVEAIEIQREVGGNLAEVLDTVAGTIRDRNLIRRQVQALSAEGRISAYILFALPIVIAGFIGVISPDYLAELTSSTIGLVMLGGAAVLMGLGGLWIRKIIRVDF
ncbi:MAG: type II secretion system F family protein [Acidimicrobiia bacterium]|nr:type II secretion system F family protein [Acidimicrobiia bacterium]